MLVITSQHRKVLAQSVLRSREAELFRRERTRGVGPTAELDEDNALRACIHQAFLKADANGFSELDAASAYAQAALDCGLGFATDPLHNWAAPAMQSTEPAAERGQILVRRMAQAAPMLTAGEWRHADAMATQLVRSLGFAEQSVPEELPAMVLRHMGTDIRRVRTLDEAGAAKVLATAAAIAQIHGLSGPRPTSVFLLPVVLFGLGCATDPRYDWVGNPELSPPNECLQTVLDRCRRHIAAHLANSQPEAVLRPIRVLPSGQRLEEISLDTVLG